MPDTEQLTLGKYTLKRKLGEGGMGEVWLAHDPDLGIDLAIKVLPPHLVEEDPRYVERFMKEARTAAQISHTNVVRLYSVGEAEGMHYMVMEYVDGPTIKDLLKKHGAMKPIAALKIVHQVALALNAAAKYNIIHRDIKPDNIMTNTAGKIKLCDLGLARQEGEAKRLTMTGTTFGTPAYISPEQAEDSSSVDQRADIYSLGATLYHMITGIVPFEATSAVGVMMKHITDPLPHPTEKKPDLPDNVCSMVCMMMAKKPEDRYQSADDLLEDIARIVKKDAPAVKLHCRAHSRELATPPPKRTDTRTFRKPSQRKRDASSRSGELPVAPARGKKRPVHLALAIVGGILIIIFLALAMSGGKDGKPGDGGNGARPTEVPAIAPA
jgi:serine/threonine-protein kinase